MTIEIEVIPALHSPGRCIGGCAAVPGISAGQGSALQMTSVPAGPPGMPAGLLFFSARKFSDQGCVPLPRSGCCAGRIVLGFGSRKISRIIFRNDYPADYPRAGASGEYTKSISIPPRRRVAHPRRFSCACARYCWRFCRFFQPSGPLPAAYSEPEREKDHGIF